MADSFQPRFVDLVRNYTTTTGTANFTLGTAVQGYRGFADEIQAGDQFYYSAIGIDHPDEFEVGRGTMGADGTISRDPVGGSFTSFSAGSKSIALVAAAEWHEKMANAVAANPVAVASRVELAALPTAGPPALLTEAGRSGLFVFDPGNRSSDVANDPAQALNIAPASDASGQSGAWVRADASPVELRWFGAAGDGETDDSQTVQAALNYFEAAGGGQLRLGAATYRVAGTILVLGSDLIIDATGATVMSDDEASAPMIYIGGDRVQILGGTWKLTGGFHSPRPFDIEGRDVTLSGATLLKVPESDGIQAYVRASADGFTMVNCETEGSNGIQLEASNSAILFNRLKAISTGGDDGIALKAIDKLTENIRIIGNSFENHAYFCSVGSQVGAYAADDPTYSYGVSNLVVEGNTGTACSGILYLKPGAISGAAGTGYDYRDGTVRQVVCSNNTLKDATGRKYNRAIVLTPSRGGRILGVSGRNNLIEARASGSSGHIVGCLDCYVVRNSTDGSAPSIIDGVDIAISFRDPFDGAATATASPGNPVNNFARFELSDPSYGSMSNIVVSLAGRGCLQSGIFVGPGLDDAVTVRSATLEKVNSSGSGAFGGIQTSSRLTVGADVGISVLGGYPYSLMTGTTADIRCPELEREAFMPTVGAGVTDAQFPHSAPGRCQLIEMFEMVTSDVPASDSTYTNIQFRNQDGSNAVFHGVYTKLTSGTDPSVVSTGFVAGEWSSIYRLRDITSSANIAQSVFVANGVLHHHKYAGNEGGGGRTLVNPRLKVRWAPY